MKILLTIVILLVDTGIFALLFSKVIMPGLWKTPTVPGYRIEHNYRPVSKLRMKYIRWVLNNDPTHLFSYIPRSASKTDAVFFDTELTIAGEETAGTLRIPQAPVDSSQLRSHSSAALFSAAASVMLNFLPEKDREMMENVLAKSGIKIDQFRKNCPVQEIVATGIIKCCRVQSGNQQLCFYESCDDRLVGMCSYMMDAGKKRITDEIRISLTGGKRQGVSRYYLAMSECENGIPGLITYLGCIEPYMRTVPDEYIMDSADRLKLQGFTIGYVDSAGVYLNSDKYNLDIDVSLLGDSIAFVKEFRGNSPFCCTLRPTSARGKNSGISPDAAVNLLISHDKAAENVQRLILALFAAVNFQCALCGAWIVQLVAFAMPVCCFVRGFSRRQYDNDFSVTQKSIRLFLLLALAAEIGCSLVCTVFFPGDMRAASIGGIVGFLPAVALLVLRVTDMPVKRAAAMMIPLAAVCMIGAALPAFLTGMFAPVLIEAACGFACSMLTFLIFRK